MRLIDADNLKHAFGNDYLDDDLCKLSGQPTIRQLIDASPTVDAAPVVHAKWLPVDDKFDAFDCSECGAMVMCKHKYCPHCGAKMDMED